MTPLGGGDSGHQKGTTRERRIPGTPLRYFPTRDRPAAAVRNSRGGLKAATRHRHQERGPEGATNHRRRPQPDTGDRRGLDRTPVHGPVTTRATRDTANPAPRGRTATPATSGAPPAQPTTARRGRRNQLAIGRPAGRTQSRQSATEPSNRPPNRAPPPKAGHRAGNPPRSWKTAGQPRHPPLPAHKAVRRAGDRPTRPPGKRPPSAYPGEPTRPATEPAISSSAARHGAGNRLLSRPRSRQIGRPRCRQIGRTREPANRTHRVPTGNRTRVPTGNALRKQRRQKEQGRFEKRAKSANVFFLKKK